MVAVECRNNLLIESKVGQLGEYAAVQIPLILKDFGQDITAMENWKRYYD